MTKLDGKVAVMTGASSGHRRSDGRDARGAGGDRRGRGEEGGEALRPRRKDKGQRGPDARGLSCDVTDEGQTHALIRRTEEEFGRVDILVNNAGVMLLSKVGKGLSDQWRQRFEM